jgi:glycerophosphoryl diester phosphodiesterase
VNPLSDGAMMPDRGGAGPDPGHALPVRCGGVFDLQGHRGGRALWPENTAEAVAGASGLGVTSVELDVVLTADGVPVVFHDLTLTPDLVRTQAGDWVGPGIAIAELTADQLAGFDVGRLRPGSRLAARFPGQRAMDGARIPHLTDICAQACRLGLRLDIEIKAQPMPGRDLRAEIVLAAIGGVAPPGTSLRSFDWPLLRRIRAESPSMPLAWLTASGPNAQPDAVAAEIAQLGPPCWQPVWAPDHRTLHRGQVTAARQAGLAVKPWTVNAPARMRDLIGWGVAGLCTDCPDLAIAVIASINAAHR